MSFLIERRFRVQKIGSVIIAIMLVLFISACSGEEDTQQVEEPQKEQNTEQSTTADDDENTNGNQEEADWKEALEAPAPPVTRADIVNFPTGEFVNMNVQLNEHDRDAVVDYFSTLPKLDESASEEMMEAYWRKTYEMFHEYYPSEESILGNLKYSAFGSPDIEDERFHFKQNLNVEILLDASGSMAAYAGGQPKMEIAKETIKSFASSLPKGANVALRVYGQEGTGSDSDKELSCSSSELVYPLGEYHAAEFDQALNKFAPAGWTPIELAIREAQQDLSEYSSENHTNIIYLVGDGITTCDDDPVQAAKELADSNIQPIVHVIGFDINSEGQKQLMEISEAVDGLYSDARNKEELAHELEKSKNIAEKWEAWKKDSEQQAHLDFQNNYWDIFEFILEWRQKKVSQDRNILYTWRALRDEGYITSEAFNYLKDKQKEHYKIIEDHHTAMEEEFESLNIEKYDDAKNAIESLYLENQE